MDGGDDGLPGREGEVVADADGVPEAGEMEGDGAADAAAGTGDDRDLQMGELNLRAA